MKGFRGERENESGDFMSPDRLSQIWRRREGVQAIGDEDAEAYIRQKVGVHVNPVIAVYDDPDDCEGKDQVFEIRFFAIK